MLADEYEEYYKKYYKQFGDKTVVLYQNGSFHNLYGIDNETERMGNVAEIAEILGIKLTRVNTNILENSRQNPLLAGFPSPTLDERVERLVNYGYSVVVIDQIAGKTPIKREVSYIRTPSTTLNTSVHKQDPYAVSVYIDQFRNASSCLYYKYIGMAAIDVTTGNSYVYECCSSINDPTLAEDNLLRFFQSFNPVEIVVNRSSKVKLDENIARSWGYRDSRERTHVFDLKPTVFRDTAKLSMTRLSAQEEYLRSYFPDHGHLDVVEYLGLEQMDCARAAFVYLLGFCAARNPKLLTSMPRPRIWKDNKNLILDTSSIIQLNIIESYYNKDKQRSIVGMLGSALSTSMGRRLLRERLVTPTTDVTELKKRYDYIEGLRGTDSAGSDIKKHLPHRDIDRLHRKITLGVLQPSELYILDKCYDKIHPLASHEIGRELPQLVKTVRDTYQSIDMNEAGKCTVLSCMRESIFKFGWNKEIDGLSTQLQRLKRTRTILCQRLSDFVAKGGSFCNYKEDKKDGCHCVMTKAQYRKFKANFEPLDFTVEDTHISLAFSDIHVDDRNKSNVKFEIDLLNRMHKKGKKLLVKLQELSIAKYLEVLQQITAVFPQMSEISSIIGQLDLYQGMARVADKYGYCRPEILPHTESSASCLEAVRLRHPLVERNVKYVPQDIYLGGSYQDGMLLYGVNQTGKSCTMKSVGVAVAMAQAGLYVSARSFRYIPYKLLSTRIMSTDCMDKGFSTFAVEMIELRSMMIRCSNRTLNLGDEVCHGTESASAVSLVAASIIHMAQVHANFIFATHLHELSKMEEVCQMDNIRHYHLTVDFKDDEIIYNRHMKEGSGSALYGIEVAKHLKVPSTVLEKAYEIRNKYYRGHDQVLLSDARSSRYNADVTMIRCKIRDCQRPAKHTHHIRYQEEGEVVEGMHKNNKENLVPLCNEHHDCVHVGADAEECLVIFGYGATGELEYEFRKVIPSLER